MRSGRPTPLRGRTAFSECGRAGQRTMCSPIRAAIRRALVRKEAAEEAGRRPDPLTRALAGLPARMGLHIVR